MSNEQKTGWGTWIFIGIIVLALATLVWCPYVQHRLGLEQGGGFRPPHGSTK